jgi:hypothetical protein
VRSVEKLREDRGRDAGRQRGREQGGRRTSALARISQPVARDRERIRTSFVLPMRPSMPSTMSSVRFV